MSGLDPTGFQVKTLSEIQAEIEADELGDIDATLDLAPDEPIGQLNGIFAKKLAEAWELLETAFHSMDPSVAEDRLLDAVCEITGTERPDDTYAKVVLSCNLTAGTVLPTTAMAAVTGDATSRWVLDSNVYPAGYTAALTGVQAVAFRSEKYGASAALAGTIGVIVTAVAGWSSVTNALDAEPGTIRETNEELRARRASELEGQGSCTLPTLKADLLKVPGVIAVKTIQNVTSATTEDGPPHSYAAVIWDGIVAGALDTSIRKVIWQNQPPGIQAVGDNVGTFVDDDGNTQSVPFYRTTQRQIIMTVVLDKDLTKYPLDGDTKVKQALVLAGNPTKTNGKQPGDTVVYNKVFGAIYGACPGINGVTLMTIGVVGLVAEGTSNLFFTDREIAVWDTSRITVS
jgi:hypothetical protein